MKLTAGVETLGLRNLGQETQTTNKIYLHSGQTRVSATPTTITTIVGSCVAVFLWDGRYGIGGATHYLLPSWDGSGQASPRYGDVALEGLFSDMKKAGARAHDLHAFVYGGGSVLVSLQNGNILGARNIERAFQWLKANPQITLIEQRTGGTKGRKINFDTIEGRAICQEL